MSTQEERLRYVLEYEKRGNPQQLLAEAKALEKGLRDAAAAIRAAYAAAGSGGAGGGGSNGGGGSSGGGNGGRHHPPNYQPGGSGGGGHPNFHNMHLNRLVNRAPGAFGRAGGFAGNLGMGLSSLGMGGAGNAAGTAAGGLYGMSYLTSGMQMLAGALGPATIGLGVFAVAAVGTFMVMKEGVKTVTELSNAIRQLSEQSAMSLADAGRSFNQYSAILGRSGAAGALGGIAGMQNGSMSSMMFNLAAVGTGGVRPGYQPWAPDVASQFGIPLYAPGSTPQNPLNRNPGDVLRDFGRKAADLTPDQRARMLAQLSGPEGTAVARLERDYERGRRNKKPGQSNDEADAATTAALQKKGAGAFIPSQKDIDNLDKLNDAQQKLAMSWSTLMAQLGAGLLPGLIKFFDLLNGGVQILLGIGHAIGAVVGFLGGMAHGFDAVTLAMSAGNPGFMLAYLTIKSLGTVMSALGLGSSLAAGPTKDMALNLGSLQAAWKGVDFPQGESQIKKWGLAAQDAFTNAGKSKDWFMANLTELQKLLANIPAVVGIGVQVTIGDVKIAAAFANDTLQSWLVDGQKLERDLGVAVSGIADWLYTEGQAVERSLHMTVSGIADWLWTDGIDVTRNLKMLVSGVADWLWTDQVELTRNLLMKVSGVADWLWTPDVPLNRTLHISLDWGNVQDSIKNWLNNGSPIPLPVIVTAPGGQVQTQPEHNQPNSAVSTGMASQTEEAAISWANDHANDAAFVNMCLQFVARAFGASAAGFNNPKEAIAAGKMEHPGDRNAPRGAIVYFTGGIADPTNGHVGISLGDGNFIGAGQHGPQSFVNGPWAGAYQGWGTAGAYGFPGQSAGSPDMVKAQQAQEEAAQRQEAASQQQLQATDEQLNAVATQLDAANQQMQAASEANALMPIDVQNANMDAQSAAMNAISAVHDAQAAVQQAEAAPEQRAAALSQAQSALTQAVNAAKQLEAANLQFQNAIKEAQIANDLAGSAGINSTAAGGQNQAAETQKKNAATLSHSLDGLKAIDWEKLGQLIEGAAGVIMVAVATMGGGGFSGGGGGGGGGGNKGGNSGGGGGGDVKPGDTSKYPKSPNQPVQVPQDDGQTLDMQSQAVQDLFYATWGVAAPARWRQEHLHALGVPGYALGGRFRIPGPYRGSDGTMVAIQGTPGEEVTIAPGGSGLGTTGRSAGGGDVTITIPITVMAMDFSDPRHIEQMTRGVSDKLAGNLQMLGLGKAP